MNRKFRCSGLFLSIFVDFILKFLPNERRVDKSGGSLRDAGGGRGHGFVISGSEGVGSNPSIYTLFTRKFSAQVSGNHQLDANFTDIK